jgi:hypothetical protein
MSQTTPLRESIAERAYAIWEQAGRPAGREEEFWLRAEAELVAPGSTSGAPPAVPPPNFAPPTVPTASPVHQIPPAIKDAVKTPGHRPPHPRVPKRA